MGQTLIIRAKTSDGQVYLSIDGPKDFIVKRMGYDPEKKSGRGDHE